LLFTLHFSKKKKLERLTSLNCISRQCLQEFKLAFLKKNQILAKPHTKKIYIFAHVHNLSSN
jgi:hypothetical protein